MPDDATAKVPVNAPPMSNLKFYSILIVGMMGIAVGLNILVSAAYDSFAPKSGYERLQERVELLERRLDELQRKK